MSLSPERLEWYYENARIGWSKGKTAEEMKPNVLHALKADKANPFDVNADSVLADEILEKTKPVAKEEIVIPTSEATAVVEPEVVEAVAAPAVGVPVKVETKPVVSSFKNIALPLAAKNVPTVPVLPNSKKAFITGWDDAATTSEEQIVRWDAMYPGYNGAAVAKGTPDGVWFFEIDSASVLDRIKAETGNDMPDTYRVRSRENRGHFYFRNTPEALEMGNIAQGPNIKFGDWSARVKNAYVVAAGSIHPHSKQPYTAVNNELPILPAPIWLIEWLKSQRVSAASFAATKTEPSRDATGLVPHGQIHGYLLHHAGKLRAMGLEAEQIEEPLLALVHKNCAPPIDESKVRAMAHSVCKSFPAGQTSELLMTQQPAAPAPAAPITSDPVVVEKYAMTEDERNVELESEFPVIMLAEQAGPSWDDSMMYGIAGDIIRKASAYCEAHQAGMYLDLLTSFGSIVGRGPYFNVNQTKHYTNEFMVRVGLTSTARKGTGRDQIDEILKLVDSDWFSRRVMSGFGSAEAIVNEVRDPMQQQVRDKRIMTGFSTIMVPGVEDKRLCIREGELASVFTLAGKKESRADVIIRDGWDGKSLRNIVKGKTDGVSNSATCLEPHISISGDTTRCELVKKMPQGSADNGFGNRFLYCHVCRVKMCPLGGPLIDWTQEVLRLRELVDWARQLQYVPLTKAASKVWGRMYVDVEESVGSMPPLAGAMCGRASAHIRRLALIFALLDEHDVVDSRHLHAAKKLWDYCQESARFVFGGTTSEQDRIVQYVRANRDGVTMPQITQQVFHKNKPAAWVEAQVNALVANGNGIILKDGKVVPTA